MIRKFPVEKYDELAARTEAPITPGMKRRFSGTIMTLEDELDTLSQVGKRLDVIKRHIYYNDPKSTEQLKHWLHDEEEKDDKFTDNKSVRLLHGIIGIMTEAGELAEVFADDSTMYGREEDIDKVNLIEECGDLMWYIGLVLSACGVDIDYCQRKNIEKLRARFPEKFNEGDALSRDLENERNALEDEEEGDIV